MPGESNTINWTEKTTTHCWGDSLTGEGDALEQSFVKDLWAVQSISSCRKYPKSLSGVRDLINFVGSMGRRANMPRSPPSIILNIIHSLHADQVPVREGQHRLQLKLFVGKGHNAFICANGEEYQIHGSKYAFILFEQNWKDPLSFVTF